MILGTQGYIELRKYVDIAGRDGGDHLIIVDGNDTEYVDCSDVELTYYADFVNDVRNRTEAAVQHGHCLGATRARSPHTGNGAAWPTGVVGASPAVHAPTAGPRCREASPRNRSGGTTGPARRHSRPAPHRQAPVAAPRPRARTGRDAQNVVRPR